MIDRNSNHILTVSGRRFWPLEPSPEDIAIEDIAHALSNICRFTGQCREFYSVAEHSVRMVQEVRKLPELALWCLLHDASEAYINDLCRPLKEWPGYATAYVEAESTLMDCVVAKFQLQLPMPEEVKYLDRVMLVTEQRDLMPPTDAKWFDVEPLDGTIYPWSPGFAKQMFLYTYERLEKNRWSSLV